MTKCDYPRYPNGHPNAHRLARTGQGQGPGQGPGLGQGRAAAAAPLGSVGVVGGGAEGYSQGQGQGQGQGYSARARPQGGGGGDAAAWSLRALDGSSWGTTFPHLFLQTYPEYHTGANNEEHLEQYTADDVPPHQRKK